MIETDQAFHWAWCNNQSENRYKISFITAVENKWSVWFLKGQYLRILEFQQILWILICQWLHLLLQLYQSKPHCLYTSHLFFSKECWTAVHLAGWHSHWKRQSLRIEQGCSTFIVVISMNNARTYFDFPVTVLARVRKIFGGLISSFNILDSVANGKPLSSISSRSWMKNRAESVWER